jgi:hypothetical protein
MRASRFILSGMMGAALLGIWARPAGARSLLPGMQSADRTAADSIPGKELATDREKQPGGTKPREPIAADRADKAVPLRHALPRHGKPVPIHSMPSARTIKIPAGPPGSGTGSGAQAVSKAGNAVSARRKDRPSPSSTLALDGSEWRSSHRAPARLSPAGSSLSPIHGTASLNGDAFKPKP